MSDAAGRSGTEGLSRARERVEEACRLLRTPSPAVLDVCAAALQQAAALVRSVSFSSTSQAEQARALGEALVLKRTTAKAAFLLERAALYHARWRRRVAEITAGYAPGGGTAVPAGRAERVCIRG